MIKTNIASAAAVFAFGLTALSGAVVALAAPATADTQVTSPPSDTSAPGTASKPAKGHQDAATPADVTAAGNRSEPTPHQLFPTKPHSPHEGQGHKGDREQHANPPHIWPATKVWPGVSAADAG
ncbi:hypothetical protein BOO86_25500 [Mycobacterium sp. CBMA 234]|uniref:hypothetical protein n=1 Tax=Mycolicibacterium sp. CBMA 234 TaxID=1918495 RepID=UPI0012DEBD63|nr:hypothetical protein [Mycolicibacterium sp. CBMA 234]MUL67853.1 hypothetical protein [Mycolicibacterium sp. CBMA 234]